MTLVGHQRASGAVGLRNHVLVLPSVVCSSHAAGEVARDTSAVAITHQHGCLHVGDDLRHTETALIGTATNPNVRAVVVVGLGCETIQGRRLATRIADRGQDVTFVGIQAEGGTAGAIAAGQAVVHERLAQAAARAPHPVQPGDVLVGIDRADEPLVAPLLHELHARGMRTIVADGATGPEAHVELATRGAQLIVSLCGSDEPPIGFAICPVIAVASDPNLYRALHDDYDLGDEGEAPDARAARVADRVLAAGAGQPTASERRGDRHFLLHRLAMTM